MEAGDLAAVMSIAEIVHPTFPEKVEVFAERLSLFPRGCLVLDGPDGAEGYVVAHPWRALSIPLLDSLIGQLPRQEGTRYIHDLALLPGARAKRAGSEIVQRLVDEARADAVPSLSLVAVYGSVPFWQRQGFAAVATTELTARLLGYGPGATFMVQPL
jgi:GNAT superfamily N-acetyltransferase